MKFPLVTAMSVFMTETDAKIGFGGCGETSVVQNFDWERADGLWYETYVDWGNSLEWFWDCTTEAYFKSEWSDDVYRISTPYRYSYWGISQELSTSTVTGTMLTREKSQRFSRVILLMKAHTQLINSLRNWSLPTPLS